MRESVSASERDTEVECVKERERVCVCVLMCVQERESVCVCK